MELVTYCGLHCELCAERSRIPQCAAALREAMAGEGWPFWAQTLPGFGEFWTFLENLQSEGCPGCRAGGGFPECQIRLCAQDRGLELCCHCPDFPSNHVEVLGTRYPTLLAHNRRLQVVGLERWLAEQEEQARRSVVYADIRYPDYESAEPTDTSA